MKTFHVISAVEMEPLALSLASNSNENVSFVFHKTSWGKFPDGTDHIVVGGFEGGHNRLSGKHVLFLASFHNNDVTLSQFYVMVMLTESFIKSLTVVLPFYPTGTMERVINEGELATASTMARLFSSLPSPGRPIKVVIYDIHTLQNRFYVSNHAVAQLKTCIPLLLNEMQKGIERVKSGTSSVVDGNNNNNDNGGGGGGEESDNAIVDRIDAVAFPDEGASKRFQHLFKDRFPSLPIIICGKVRDGEKRIVHVEEGDATGRNVVIIDDLVQTGGTLYECALALKAHGAKSVSAFVSHAVFPNDSFRRFGRGGDRNAFKRFWVTNSNPHITNQLPRDDVFRVLDISSLLLNDLLD